MLNNLIDNALRYAGKPGSNITVRLTHSTNPVITVEDEGPGIPKEEQLRIFERFHRVPGSPSGGCGLGLAIVKEIAHRHRAKVSSYSKNTSNGAVFQVLFEHER